LAGGRRRYRRGPEQHGYPPGYSGTPMEGPRFQWRSLKYRWYLPYSARGRRRGRKSRTTMSLSDHLNRGSDVSKRGDLCNLAQKSSLTKISWGREHLRAAKAAHLPCQVYEGKKKKKEYENDKSKSKISKRLVGQPTALAGYPRWFRMFGSRRLASVSSPEAMRVIRPSRCFHAASLGRFTVKAAGIG
jgi:hypothetical protein